MPITTARKQITLAVAALALGGGLATTAFAQDQPAQTATSNRATSLEEAPAAHRRYDGKDPMTTGCAHDSRKVHTAKEIRRGKGAKSILMYSPSCRTVWVLCEVIRPEGTWTKWGGSVNRTSDGAQQKCTHRSGINEKYSNMLNDAGVTSWGFAYAYIGNNPYEFSATTRSY